MRMLRAHTAHTRGTKLVWRVKPDSRARDACPEKMCNCVRDLIECCLLNGAARARVRF